MKCEVTYTVGATDLTPPAETLPGELGEGVLTEIQWSGDREGKISLIIPAAGAKAIVATMMTAMMGEAQTAEDTQLDAEGLDAYSEALSQFLGQGSQALRQDPGGEVNLLAMPENTRLIDFTSSSIEETLGSAPMICSLGQITLEGSDPIEVYTIMEPALTKDAQPVEAKAGEAQGAPAQGGAEPATPGSLGEGLDYSERIKGLKLPVQVTLAEKKERLKMIMDLVPGSIVEFKKSSEEFLDMRIGKTTIARGEAVIVDERFGLQIREIMDVIAEIKKHEDD